jgi:hypothetical protein
MGRSLRGVGGESILSSRVIGGWADYRHNIQVWFSVSHKYWPQLYLGLITSKREWRDVKLSGSGEESARTDVRGYLFS